jgi:hypothetical protein
MPPARLQHLLDCGFGPQQADKVFEAINLPAPADIDRKLSDLRALGFADPVKMVTSSPPILGLAIENIRGKLSNLRALGFADPVKMVTSLPTILGYARERLLLCRRIVMHLDDAEPGMLANLINKRRKVIDAVAAAEPRNWSEVRAIIAASRSKQETGGSP